MTNPRLFCTRRGTRPGGVSNGNDTNQLTAPWCAPQAAADASGSATDTSVSATGIAVPHPPPSPAVPPPPPPGAPPPRAAAESAEQAWAPPPPPNSPPLPPGSPPPDSPDADAAGGGCELRGGAEERPQDADTNTVRPVTGGVGRGAVVVVSDFEFFKSFRLCLDHPRHPL